MGDYFVWQFLGYQFENVVFVWGQLVDVVIGGGVVGVQVGGQYWC